MYRLLSRHIFASSTMLTGCLVILMLSSCATQRAYDDVTPTGDVAILHIASDFAVWMDNPAIVKLDGEYLKKADVVKLELLPGDHIVQMRCTRRFSTIFTPIPHSGPIKFTVEAPHHYNVYCDVTADKTYYWIEESDTGGIAGGERP